MTGNALLQLDEHDLQDMGLDPSNSDNLRLLNLIDALAEQAEFGDDEVHTRPRQVGLPH